MGFYEKLDLPPMPQVINKILEIDENDITLSLNDLHTLVSSDPGLVSKIIKLANSPFYSRMNNISDLQTAMQMLGFKSIKSLTLLISVSRLIPNAARNLIVQRELWMRAIVRALITRQLAAKTGHRDIQESLFMMAMLKNIGQHIMQSRFPSHYDNIFQEAGSGADIEKLHALEEETFSISSNRLSILIMERWNFPDKFRCAASLKFDKPEEAAANCGENSVLVNFGEIILFYKRLTENITDLPEYQEKFETLFQEYAAYLNFDDKQKDYFQNRVETLFAEDDLYTFCEELFAV